MSAPAAVEASPAASAAPESDLTSPRDGTCQAPAPPAPPPRDDLLAPGRRLAVVSTAAPPWMTGTAVNPTLRAAFLAEALGCKRESESEGGGGGKQGERGREEEDKGPSTSPSRPPRVTLVVPWLNKTDQASLFPEGLLFDSPREQEKALRDWVEARAGFQPQFELMWYPARYDRTLLGVFPVGDLAARVRDELCGPAQSGEREEEGEETGKKKTEGAGAEKGEGGGQPKQEEARGGVEPRRALSRAASSFSNLLLSRSPSRGALGNAKRRTPLLDGIILEEPEHLTWHHTGARWTGVAPWVVGVVHTNYRELGGRNAGPVMGALAGALARWLAASHCHGLVRLSGATARLPRQATACVHGVAPRFAEVGREVKEALERRQGPGEDGSDASAPSASLPSPPSPFSKGAYALGKVVWGKGWEELVELMGAVARGEEEEEERGGGGGEQGEQGEGNGRAGGKGGRGESGGAPRLSVDAFGDGAALPSVVAAAALARAPVAFHPKTDHLHAQLRPYRAFVNASTSDVVATTSLEALAMGKWLVCARHPCNDFAAGFANCLIYDDAAGFAASLRRALSEEPRPLSEEELEELGWAAATRRLGEAARRGAGAGKGGEAGGQLLRGGSLSGDGGGGGIKSSPSSSSLRKRPSSSPSRNGSGSRHSHHHHHHHHRHHHHHLHVASDENKPTKEQRRERAESDDGEDDDDERRREERLALEAALTSVAVGDADDTSLMIAKARLSAAANALAEAAFARAYAALLRVEPLRVAVGAGARTTEQHAHASISRKDGITYSPPEGGDAQAGVGGSRLGAFFAAAVAARPSVGGGFSCSSSSSSSSSSSFRVEFGQRPCGFDWRWR